MNATNKTIYLVTGAAGFLGGTICRQLVERGENVRAFVLPGDKAIKFIPSEVEIVEGDLCDIQSLEKLFSVPEGYETIVMHIASIVTVNPDYNQKVMDVNVGGTQNIIDLCLLHKECKKLVYCSSTGAIPELPKGTAIGETTGTVIQIINGEIPAGIDGSFNLCDVRDLANGTILAAEKGKTGSCYILGNEEVSFKEFSKMVSKEAGCKKIKVFLPLKIANFLAGMLEKQAKKKGTKPLMTTFSVYNLARNNCFDSSKAKNELGYTTRSYEETLRDEIAWLKKEGKIA